MPQLSSVGWETASLLSHPPAPPPPPPPPPPCRTACHLPWHRWCAVSRCRETLPVIRYPLKTGQSHAALPGRRVSVSRGAVWADVGGPLLVEDAAEVCGRYSIRPIAWDQVSAADWLMRGGCLNSEETKAFCCSCQKRPSALLTSVRVCGSLHYDANDPG